MSLLNDSLSFIKDFIGPMLRLKRKVFFPGIRRRETLAEHIIGLLYFAEFFVRREKLDLDIHKIREYILAHDMQEPFTPHAQNTGFDICRFGAPPALIRDKKRVERQALMLICRQFKELDAMTDSNHKYEEQDDDESRFVKALDALLPMLNIVLDKGRTNHVDNITFQQWRTDREWRIKQSPPLWKCYKEEVLPLIVKNERELFARETAQQKLPL
ncbi:MAG: HD domain-containing protein [bacterium]|nr:HD domain-containing protein [bacterium]